MTESTDLSPTGANEIGDAITALSYADLIADPTVDRVLGRSVVDKAEMIGKPFIITGITFNKSDKQAGGDFVSLEITTADDSTLVINDSSTGIRRQVVQYAVAKGWLTIGETVKENEYDAPASAFGTVEGLSSRDDETGAFAIDVAIRLRAPRGLRVSSYPATESRPAGTTYYLA